VRAPRRERLAVLVAGPDIERRLDAPFVRERPGFGRERGGGAFREDLSGPIRACDRLFPQQPLLLRRQERGQVAASGRVQRLLVAALDEGVERQDIGRLPRGKAGGEPGAIEFGLERLGEAPVRREDRDALGVPALESLEELLTRDRGMRGHGHDVTGRKAHCMSLPALRTDYAAASIGNVTTKRAPRPSRRSA
jgi:hypothetical protein